MASAFPPRDLLVDVSRLVWRYWTRRLPTGIDRVCLAYLAHYGARAQAVVQYRGAQFILAPRQSDALFALLLASRPPSCMALARCLVRAAPGARRAAPARGQLYLNVGHTGLDAPTLPRWIRREGLRAIYMVHDLIPLTHPQFCRAGEAERHGQRIANMLASAAGIIGNSRATLDELAAFAQARGMALPPTVAAWISGAPPPPPKSGTPPLQRPYFVVLGTIEGRKNHKLLLDLWRNLVAERGDDAPTLVVIGQRGWEAQDALALLDRPDAFAGHVRHFARCTDAELAAWLAGARALLMPSFAEGFGLPVIEALRLGTPVIASDLPVFREIAGTIPTFLAPDDEAGWRAAIEAFDDDGGEPARQRAAMRDYAAPDWPGHFAIVDRWLKTL